MENFTIISFIVYFFLFAVGAAFGSFLNSWAWRTKENISIAGNRSMCVRCRRPLKWRENIPIISFLVLQGKCRGCGSPIPRHYPVVEIAAGVLFVLLAAHYLAAPELGLRQMLRLMIFAGLLAAISLFDYLYFIIPTELVWAGAAVGAVMNLFVFNVSAVSMGLGAAVGGGFFVLQYIVSKGRWVGGGDARLGAMIGIWLGFPLIIASLFTSYIVGAIVGTALIIFKGKKGASAIPFGPYLALGAMFAMMWGGEAIERYLKIIGR